VPLCPPQISHRLI
jgi:hypothetical protein